MLTERRRSWHIFSVTMACMFLAAMLTGAVFAAIYEMWVMCAAFVAVSIFQTFLITYVMQARRRHTG
jgi:uncharacterized membrane protein YoaK (UPF0700 family)